jgi:hypothetical protein
MRRVQQMQPESSSHGGKEEVWGRLWKLYVPNVKKNFYGGHVMTFYPPSNVSTGGR